jgi:hypothetical protein
MVMLPDWNSYDGDDMEYKGITIYSEPRRGSVRRLSDLETTWYLEHLPLTQMDQKLTLSEAFEQATMDNPKLFAELKRFQEDVDEYKEIMLATTLTYEGVVELEDTLSISEFDELVAICKEATGGVQDFFGNSGSDTSLEKRTSRPVNRESTNSPGQRGGSTAE